MVSSRVVFTLKSSVTFLKPGIAIAVRSATMHSATTISMRVKPFRLKAPTLEYLNILVGSNVRTGADTRLGKTAPIKVQSPIKLRNNPGHPKIFKHSDTRPGTDVRMGKTALENPLKAL
jgi:hypothetical protein